ncbi:hypothetical protein BU26DRAFT_33308 [Trematosphaeria pertusa]|uniref:Uncharacterized protein n=1 Tax=Trematosphaeria pertusa TaxID=390896 RepID=A0A6A6J533_9PLEO|nr:uncharacterized protein BU26DRAFT_33308 [Trematosphaeria pertusa]KAF2256990.1 hypothetical protein BU26DRAFT_33308 [Trematosphaeria pertusa]
MAHQAHALPWQTLADNFKFVYANTKYYGRTNLYPCLKPGQGKQLQHFARVFARLMDDFSAQELEKYPDELTPPTDDEIFIPDSTVKRISKTVKYYKTPKPRSTYSNEPKELRLTEAERKLPYWLLNIRDDASYPKDEVLECVELLKTLVSYGEMEPLMRLASHPAVHLQTIWSFPYDRDIEHGWTDIKNCALMAYLCLNMFLVKPELYDPASRSQKLNEMRKARSPVYSGRQCDYRNTSSYQKMLVHCTFTRSDSQYEVCALPHREFFGIERHMISTPNWNGLAKAQVGYGPWSELLDAKYRSWYVPSVSDIPTVVSIMKHFVPTELALQILEHADYTAKRRVPVPNDPLHRDNAEELKKYLSYCWKVLARVDMLLKANGKWIDWEYEVTECIYDLWGVPYPKMCTTKQAWEISGRREGDIDPSRVLRTFT